MSKTGFTVTLNGVVTDFIDIFDTSGVRSTTLSGFTTSATGYSSNTDLSSLFCKYFGGEYGTITNMTNAKIGGADINVLYSKKNDNLPYRLTGQYSISSNSDYNTIITFTGNGSIKFLSSSYISSVKNRADGKIGSFLLVGGGGSGGGGGKAAGGGGGGGQVLYATNVSISYSDTKLFNIVIGSSDQDSSIELRELAGQPGAYYYKTITHYCKAGGRGGGSTYGSVTRRNLMTSGKTNGGNGGGAPGTWYPVTTDDIPTGAYSADVGNTALLFTGGSGGQSVKIRDGAAGNGSSISEYSTGASCYSGGSSSFSRTVRQYKYGCGGGGSGGAGGSVGTTTELAAVQASNFGVGSTFYKGGEGGPGFNYTVMGKYYGGGGGGGAVGSIYYTNRSTIGPPGAVGGTGGGGDGGTGAPVSSSTVAGGNGIDGLANSGGGGGGGGSNYRLNTADDTTSNFSLGGSGGSGVCIWAFNVL